MPSTITDEPRRASSVRPVSTSSIGRPSTSMIMKRAGGATPSSRSAAARPPLRMFEVDHPRWTLPPGRPTCQPSSLRSGGEAAALVVHQLEDHAAVGDQVPCAIDSAPADVDGKGDDLALAVPLHRRRADA